MFKPSANERHPDYFAVTDFVISTLGQWVDHTPIPAPETALGIVSIASIVRAVNLYRSINLLLSTDHWEDAAILSRSLFELLLNLEEIYRDESQEESKSKKYLRFDMLQDYLHAKNMVEYDVETGRRTRDVLLKLKDMDALSKSLFREFRSQNGRTEWQASWCGKSVHKLSRDSKEPLRLAQYRILYSHFSAFTHSSPASVMSTMSLGATPVETEKLFEGSDECEHENMSLVLMLSTVWLLQVLFTSKAYLSSYDVAWNFDVLNRLRKCYGLAQLPLPRE